MTLARTNRFTLSRAGAPGLPPVVFGVAPDGPPEFIQFAVWAFAKEK